MASWLVRSSLDRVRAQAMPGDIVLCSWARHFILAVPLSTQLYKWAPVDLMPLWVSACYRQASHSGRSGNTQQVASCLRNER